MAGKDSVTITHVCISDLHAGAMTSLLSRPTPGGTGPQDGEPIETVFAAALGDLLEKTAQAAAPAPNLVLLGDGPDLSLAPPKEAFAALGLFLGALFDTGRFSATMPFVPGNHDHAIWTEERFSDRQISDGGYAHVTPAFAPPGDVPASRTLENLLARCGVKVPIYYPNYGLLDRDRTRAIVFHHGHFIESIYRAMTGVLTVLRGGRPETPSCAELERDNGAWIDFGWSTLGDTGLLGKETAIAYHLLLAGGAADRFNRRLAAHLKDWLLRNLNLPDTLAMSAGLDMFTAGLVDALVGKAAQLQRYDYNEHLSAASARGLTGYLAGAVAQQMRAALDVPGVDPPPELAVRTTFVFGHTHKPFEDQLAVDGFAQPVSVYNTGGWILDTSLLSTVEGASVVFVDADLNTAALRLFRPPANIDTQEAATIPTVDAASVVSADPTPDAANPLVGALRAYFTALDDDGQSLWRRFSVAAARGYSARQGRLLEMAARADRDALRTGGMV